MKKFKSKLLSFTVGLIFIIVGGIITKSTYEVMHNGELIKGEITGVKRKLSSSNTRPRTNNYDYTYAPIVKYTCGGILVEQESKSSSSFYPNIGSEIEIYCNKNNPYSFIENNFFNKYVGLIFVIIGGLIIILETILGLMGVNQE